jgi:hypothetical protein
MEIRMEGKGRKGGEGGERRGGDGRRGTLKGGVFFIDSGGWTPL